MMTIGASLCSIVLAQDFPYAVPQAPEFDGTGNPMRAEPREQPYSNRKSQSYRPGSVENAAPVNYPSDRSYVRQEAAPRAPEPTAAPPVSGYPAPPPRVPTQAAARPQQQPPAPQRPQVQERSDCSQFPMLIARSQSDAEMQITSRRYLTCLLENGWNMDQARQQVINTIEAAYRPGR